MDVFKKIAHIHMSNVTRWFHLIIFILIKNIDKHSFLEVSGFIMQK